MKKLSLLLGLIFLSSISYAAEIESSGPMRKLQRGFVNVALSPMEISNEMAEEKSENFGTFWPSWIPGLARGSVFTVGRALAGVYDIVTFPLPLPKDYAPLIQPEFAWDHFKTSPTVQNR